MGEQIYMQNDCRDAFWCSDSDNNQGCSLSCDEDQIVEFDFATGKMKCDAISNQPDSCSAPATAAGMAPQRSLLWPQRRMATAARKESCPVLFSRPHWYSMLSSSLICDYLS